MLGGSSVSRGCGSDSVVSVGPKIIISVSPIGSNCRQWAFFYVGVERGFFVGKSRRKRDIGGLHRVSDSVAVVRVSLVGVRNVVQVRTSVHERLLSFLTVEESERAEKCLAELAELVSVGLQRDCVTEGWSVNVGYIR